VFSDAIFTASEMLIEQNDLLIAFTDGITDALNANEEFFGRERFIRILLEADTTPAMLLKDIEEHLHHFIGTADQFDDITVFAIKNVVH
jgi:serine phosphatase RsbU (regulator of sigma subunit)